MHMKISNNVLYACVTQDDKSFVAVIPRSRVEFSSGHCLPLILGLGQVVIMLSLPAIMLREIINISKIFSDQQDHPE